MTKPRLLFLGVLIFTSITGSSCSYLSRSRECLLQGATYGGRISLTTYGVSSSFLRGRRMVIFQRPPENLITHGGFGIGRKWIGTDSRICQGPGSQAPDQCLFSGDPPCIDAGIPCETEPPSYGRSDPLEFSEVTSDSITVSFSAWDETTDHGNGPITGYKIVYRQKGGETFQEYAVTRVDGNRLSHPINRLTAGTNYQFQIVVVRNGEPPEGPPSKIQSIQTLCEEPGPVGLTLETSVKGDTTFNLVVSWQQPRLTANCHISKQRITLHQLDKDGGCETPLGNPRPEFVELSAARQRKTFKNVAPYSLFNVTYVAVNPSGPYMTSQSIRTPELAPTGKPIDLRSTPKSDSVDLRWSAPACGKRNGIITSFNYTVLNNNRKTDTDSISSDRRQAYTIYGLSIGVRWTFKLRACNSQGCGPMTTATGRMK